MLLPLCPAGFGGNLAIGQAGFVTDIVREQNNPRERRKMIKNRLAVLRRSKNEEGFSIAEALVAAVVILVVLTATALGTGAIFETQTMNESRNRAVAIAQDRIARAQIATFREIGYPASYEDLSKVEGGLGGVTEYNGEEIRFFDDTNGAGGIIDLMLAFDVMPYERTFIGETELDVNTYVTSIPQNRFDGAPGSFRTSDDLAPARVTVVVQWDTKEGTQSVVRSLVRYPAIDECAPKYTLDDPSDANIPGGCKNAA